MLLVEARYGSRQLYPVAGSDGNLQTLAPFVHQLLKVHKQNLEIDHLGMIVDDNVECMLTVGETMVSKEWEQVLISEPAITWGGERDLRLTSMPSRPHFAPSQSSLVCEISNQWNEHPVQYAPSPPRS